MQEIKPMLWFDTQAEEAAKFYVSVFPNSRILQTTRYGDHGPMPKGLVMTVEFELAGQRFTALNGGPAFRFTEAISLVVNVEDQKELDAIWSKLLEGGGQPVQCGWLKDRYGLSWQVTPTILGELMKDPARGNRVMQALLEMVKLDIDALKKA
jgi:predicted 3-demethylubiquinone-9 3-methyltransferase (glyoxalase superfamily)